jgi:hypothetical protein
LPRFGRGKLGQLVQHQQGFVGQFGRAFQPVGRRAPLSHECLWPPDAGRRFQCRGFADGRWPAQMQAAAFGPHQAQQRPHKARAQGNGQAAVADGRAGHLALPAVQRAPGAVIVFGQALALIDHKIGAIGAIV